MANIKNIMEQEEGNTSCIHLHKEGVFYTAYEHSCYAFVHFLKPFKVCKRYVKAAETDVVSTGVPTNGLNALLGERVHETDEKEVNVPLTDSESFSDSDFWEWKNTLPMTEFRKAVKDSASNEQDDVATLIRQFPLEQKTPVDCMMFVMELKRLCGNSK